MTQAVTTEARPRHRIEQRSYSGRPVLTVIFDVVLGEELEEITLILWPTEARAAWIMGGPWGLHRVPVGRC